MVDEERVILRGHPGVGPDVEGPALVTADNFSARYDVNRATGTFSREGHALYGRSLAGAVCVFNSAKGGVTTAWALHDMKVRGVGPVGLIFRATNPIMVQGAVLGGIAVMDRLEPDPLGVIETGDLVRLHPREGTVEVIRRRGESSSV
ncbi:MAG: aconitase X swivel domain-containing protein [Chloroflexota bacterium]